MDNLQIGKLIQGLRKQKGLTQQQLADMLNLSNKTISKWESGAGSPDISNLPPLADALGVSVDELLRGKLRAAVPEKSNTQVNVNIPKELTPEHKKERALILLAASIGALLGILAWNHGWLG